MKYSINESLIYSNAVFVVYLCISYLCTNVGFCFLAPLSTSTSFSFTTCLFDISIHVGCIYLYYIPSNNHVSVENEPF